MEALAAEGCRRGIAWEAKTKFDRSFDQLATTYCNRQLRTSPSGALRSSTDYQDKASPEAGVLIAKRFTIASRLATLSG